ncbi:PASTA domain-containing protein [Nonomuraea cavernae]|uniref:PASTA domain-containing protein n=1 Tax=Nonomuraea cavernae TaxID=2045107 RepID=UPI0033E53656
MKAEEALAQAMADHVADVQAAPTLGGAVRRGHRAHVVRFRTAGAALVTAAAAVAVPLALNTGQPVAGPAASYATGEDRAVIATVKVPSVVGMDVADAVKTLRDAGLVVNDPETETAKGNVSGQEPAADTEVARGEVVMLTVGSPGSMPQDLGDLGDGRTFGGIHLGYLPEGLAWSRWSGKDGFGEKSYTTSFAPGGDEKDGYGIQVVVFEGQATRHVRQRLATFPGRVDIGGKKGYLTSVTEGGESMQEAADDTTLTIGWIPRAGLAVEVYLSPGYAGRVDGPAELRKVAEGIELRE